MKNLNKYEKEMSACDESYRYGGPMRERLEPHVYDTVDEMRRMQQDHQVLAAMLRWMGASGGYEN
jgi:hypothetical protein